MFLPSYDLFSFLSTLYFFNIFITNLFGLKTIFKQFYFNTSTDAIVDSNFKIFVSAIIDRLHLQTY